MPDLLPWNATPQERALSEATTRVGDVETPLREMWDPDTCPPALLAWLAWAFSVDEWDSSWTDAQKREFIKSSIEIHRYKGTIGAVRDALRALQFDAQVQEWFAQVPAGDPYTFGLFLTVDQVGIRQDQFASIFSVIERTKNLRSHLSSISLVVRSVGGPRTAVTAGLGSEIEVSNYVAFIPFMALNETTLAI